MTIPVFVGRFLTDSARNRVNLFLLVIVPAVFVGIVANTMADAAQLLGGPARPAVETATAGWAAAFLAGIGMYFQTAATRDTDQRLVVAGLTAARMVAARLLTGLTLALLASATALVALAIRTGIDVPSRVVPGTMMFAIIYVTIGAAVGSLVSNPVNGTVVVLFVWIVDVFFGPAMGAAERLATRWLPTHFVTLWMVNLPSRHGGRLSDFQWALTWTIGAVVAASALAVARTRRGHRRVRRAKPGSLPTQLEAASRGAWRDARRNRVMWVLFVVVPVAFILGADAVTPNRPIALTVEEHGGQLAQTFTMPDVHGATMAPIAIASLTALVGLFTLLDSRDADNRTALAGMRPGALLTARLAVLGTASLFATTISLATTALVFHAVRWPTYAAGNVLIALTYALIGALLAPVFGRVGGVFMAFLLPFLDIGITQSPMLHPEPTRLAKLLPGYGGSRILLDGALTRGFDEPVPLLIGGTWLTALALAVALAYRRTTQPAGRR